MSRVTQTFTVTTVSDRELETHELAAALATKHVGLSLLAGTSPTVKRCPVKVEPVEDLRIVLDVVGIGDQGTSYFVEIERPDGSSVGFGDWHKRDDGLSEIRIRAVVPTEETS